MEGFKFEYKKINSSNIVSDLTYQRPVDSARVKRIVSNFNPNLVNPIKVSYRDGKYYGFNGMHTRSALVLRNGNKPLMVDCKVYYGMTQQDEARLFAEQDGISKKPQSNQKLKSLYVAKDIDVIEWKNTIEGLGIQCDFTGGQSDWKVICYSTVYNIFIRRGRKRLENILKIIIEAWNACKESMQKEIIIGLDLFLQEYEGEYSRKTLVKQLSKVSPQVIIRDGKAMSIGGNKRYARVMLTLYNHRLREKRLEDRL